MIIVIKVVTNFSFASIVKDRHLLLLIKSSISIYTNIKSLLIIATSRHFMQYSLLFHFFSLTLSFLNFSHGLHVIFGRKEINNILKNYIFYFVNSHLLYFILIKKNPLNQTYLTNSLGVNHIKRYFSSSNYSFFVQANQQ